MHAGGSRLQGVFLAGAMGLLYLPLLVMMLFSFNDSKRGVVWRGFSWRHYVDAWNNADLLAAFGNSLWVAVLNAIGATALGLLAALSIGRLPVPGLRLYRIVMMMPLVIPEICLGIALLVLFRALGWPWELDWPWELASVLLAHVTFSLPFCALLILARLRQLNAELELAASDLGASSWQALRDIVLPQLRPALIASALLAFTLSLDDFVVTFFTAQRGTQMLPVKVFSMVKFGSTPQVNAASTVLVLITFVALLVAMRFYRRR